MSASTTSERRAFVQATMAASCVTTAAFIPLISAFRSGDYWAAQIWLPTYAALFGYLGAASFLWPAFSIASRVRLGRWDYPVAGVFAGIAHTLAARAVMMASGNDPGLLMLVGGFQLAWFLGPGPFEIFRLMLPACLGGWVAGWIYDQALGREVIVEDRLKRIFD